MNNVFNNADFELIMRTELFRGTAEGSLQRILNVSGYELELFQKDDVIYSPTDFKRSLGIILDGQLRVTKENAEGREIVMSTLHRGAMFGAAALFNSEHEFQTKITAVEPCRIFFFSQRIIMRLIEREPKIAENYIRYLSDRILFLNKKIYFLTSGTAEQRLSSFLLNNLSEYDETRLPMSMTEIAASLNISRASFYRAMDSITDSGAIVKNGKMFRIADVEKLCSFIV